MRRNTIVTALSCFAGAALLLAWAGTLEPSAPPAPTMTPLSKIDAKLDTLIALHTPFQFVGASTSTAQGGVGWRVLNEICRQEFGTAFPDVRMCTTEEVMKTPARRWPSLSTGPLGFWMHPVFVVARSTDVVDITANVGQPEQMNCNAWQQSSTSYLGIVLHNSGQIWRVQCNNSLGVACCAPAQ